MLILKRQAREAITIATDHGRITLTVVEIRGDKVRLGIDAPVDCPIVRSELLSTPTIRPGLRQRAVNGRQSDSGRQVEQKTRGGCRQLTSDSRAIKRDFLTR